MTRHDDGQQPKPVIPTDELPGHQASRDSLSWTSAPVHQLDPVARSSRYTLMAFRRLVKGLGMNALEHQTESSDGGTQRDRHIHDGNIIRQRSKVLFLVHVFNFVGITAVATVAVGPASLMNAVIWQSTFRVAAQLSVIVDPIDLFRYCSWFL